MKHKLFQSSQFQNGSPIHDIGIFDSLVKRKLSGSEIPVFDRERSENINPPDFIGNFVTHTKRISRIEIFAQRRDRPKWGVLKLARLSGCMVILPVLAIFLSCSRGISPAEEQPVPKISDSDRSVRAANQEDMSKKFKGTVADVIDAGRHIYVQVDTGERRVWVAVPVFDGKVGDTVLVPPGVPVADFHSKTLNRDFGMIYFVGGIHRVDKGSAE